LFRVLRTTLLVVCLFRFTAKSSECPHLSSVH
jgi:hypothetical protein